MNVELTNLDQLREDANLFPLEDIGVAQGCALSPLFGNILLSRFDQALNSGACTCIRYIDDFVILGPSEQAVSASFMHAVEILQEFDMVAYQPGNQPDKAESGCVMTDGLNFLGVEIINGSIRPSAKNRGRIIQSVNEVIQANVARVPHEDRCSIWNYDQSFVKCLMTLNAIVSGWGNQYYFCNDRKVMDDLDQKIGNLLLAGAGEFRTKSKKLGPLGRRRLIGVKSLHDCKVDPIVWKVQETTQIT